jgi:hypothetical protein
MTQLVEAMKNRRDSEAVKLGGCTVLAGASTVHDLMLTLTRWIDAARSEGAVPPKWSEVLRAVVIRITRFSVLDKAGQELAARAYLVGVSSGMYGEESAIAHGMRVGYSAALKRYRTPRGRCVDRLFTTLMNVGRTHGRSVIWMVTAGCETYATKSEDVQQVGPPIRLMH